MKAVQLIFFFLLISIASFGQGIYNQATASGTDTYTATVTPSFTSYYEGQKFTIKFTNANTGASTININSKGAITLVKEGGTALEADDIKAGEIKLLVYDGTNMQIVGGTGGGASTAEDVEFTPAGTIAADNVQDAIEELDSEKAPASGSTNYWKTSGTTTLTGNVSIEPSTPSTVDIGTFSNRVATYSVRTSSSASMLSGSNLIGAHATLGAILQGTEPGTGAFVRTGTLPEEAGFFGIYNTGDETAGDSIVMSISTVFDPVPSSKMKFYDGEVSLRSTSGLFLESAQIHLVGVTQDNTKDQVLVKDGSTNQVYYRDASTISSPEPVASTGTDVVFDVPRTYGHASAATGNITFSTTGFREGVTQLMIHNDSSEPTFESGMVVIGGEYVPNVDNYIMFHAVKSNLILVTISQAQE